MYSYYCYCYTKFVVYLQIGTFNVLLAYLYSKHVTAAPLKHQVIEVRKEDNVRVVMMLYRISN